MNGLVVNGTPTEKKVGDATDATGVPAVVPDPPHQTDSP